MNRNKTCFITLIVVLLLTGIDDLSAQTGNDTILFNAMHDEIDRGMEQLSYKDYAKPCYISYELNDSKSLNIQASLGSIVSSDTSFSRGWSFRLIVGSFEINDENFRGQNQQGSNGMGGAPQIFPIENDYYGIRRGFWLNSNDIYLRAGANHREKLNLIEKGKIKAEALEINDFSRSEPVEMMLPGKFTKPDIDKLEKKVAALSDAFYRYPELDFSSASLSFHQNIVYFINSEGTRFRLPLNLARLSVSVSREIDVNKTIYSSFSMMAASPEEFPSNDTLKLEIEKLVADIKANESAESMEDDYTGPVLFIGPIAAEVLMDNLFDYDKSLYAERNDLVVDYNGDVYFAEIENEWQSKMDKKILPDGISISAKPHLKSWNGKPIMGSYPIDSEGIIPPDSIQLVKNGVLKNMLCSRTPTSLTNQSNGHYPYTFSYGNIGHTRAPSVIQITNENGADEIDLKKELMDMATDEGLDYAIIVRSIPSEIADMPYNYYKVDLETGEEILLDNISVAANIEVNDMKKIKLGNKIGAVNSGLSSATGSYSSGNITSYIGPMTLLVEELDVNAVKERDKIHTAGDEISNPLNLVNRNQK
ncbi:MAG: hypothetical protein KQI35_11300 [Bacteroidetes bacterium]|nr:hypothetical protein [Bacteroidota bacterium]